MAKDRVTSPFREARSPPDTVTSNASNTPATTAATFVIVAVVPVTLKSAASI